MSSCQKPGCDKPCIKQGKYCDTHRSGTPCAVDECTKTAQGGTDFCIAHKGGRRCQHPDGCDKSAVGGTDFCVAHKGGRRCQHPDGCDKSAQGGTAFCKAHKGGRRCQHPDGCDKSARGGTDFCVAHKGGRRCQHPDGCDKSAQGATHFCVAHKGGHRCPNCIDWIDSRSGKKYFDGYCATCFKRVFPSDPRSAKIYEHSKEIRVRNAIAEAAQNDPDFEGFVHDTPLYTGHCDCTHRRRVDHRKLIGGTILAVETDEFGHRGYDERDEVIRYDDLYMIHSGKWVYVRYNPDTKGVDMEDTLPVLLKTIKNQVRRIKDGQNTDLVEIIRLY